MYAGVAEYGRSNRRIRRGGREGERTIKLLRELAQRRLPTVDRLA